MSDKDEQIPSELPYSVLSSPQRLTRIPQPATRNLHSAFCILHPAKNRERRTENLFQAVSANSSLANSS